MRMSIFPPWSDMSCRIHEPGGELSRATLSGGGGGVENQSKKLGFFFLQNKFHFAMESVCAQEICMWLI